MAYCVIFEFPSLGAAQSLYVSPAYQPLKALRQEAGSATIVGVEGGPGAVTETRRTARVAARNILAASGSMRVAPTGR